MTKLERENIHYHSVKKGCIIKKMKVPVCNNREMKVCFCEVHQIDCCMCGWEWGWHNGDDNRAMKNEEALKELDNKIKGRPKKYKKKYSIIKD